MNQRLRPDTVKVWCVEVAGKVFPAQLVREAANQTVDARGTARKARSVVHHRYRQESPTEQRLQSGEMCADVNRRSAPVVKLKVHEKSQARRHAAEPVR